MQINTNENEMTQVLEADQTEIIDIVRYNGKITAYNPSTGQHRTFEIKTARKGNLEGKRIISLLHGPDNQSDYVGFGFVNEDGSIRVWKKHQGTQFEKLARFIERAEYHTEKHGVQFQFATKCRKCNRELTDPESIALGIGPKCRGDV